MNIKPYVKLYKSQNVGYVEFYNPPHNALPAQMLSELTIAITNAGKDDDIGIIVLKSGGNVARESGLVPGQTAGA